MWQRSAHPRPTPPEPSSRFHAGVRQRTHERRLSRGPCVFQDQPECGLNRGMVRGGLRDSWGQPRASRMPSRVGLVWKAGERRGQT